MNDIITQKLEDMTDQVVLAGSPLPEYNVQLKKATMKVVPIPVVGQIATDATGKPIVG